MPDCRVYEELRKLAVVKMAPERPGHTSQATALGLGFLNSNPLANLALPPDLNHLTQIELGQNELATVLDLMCN